MDQKLWWPGPAGEARSRLGGLYLWRRRELQGVHLANKLHWRRGWDFGEVAEVFALQRVLVLAIPRMGIDASDVLGPVATLLERLSHHVFGNLVDLAEHSDRRDRLARVVRG